MWWDSGWGGHQIDRCWRTLGARRSSKVKSREDSAPRIDRAVCGHKTYVSIDHCHGLIRRWLSRLAPLGAQRRAPPGSRQGRTVGPPGPPRHSPYLSRPLECRRLAKQPLNPPLFQGHQAFPLPAFRLGTPLPDCLLELHLLLGPPTPSVQQTGTIAEASNLRRTRFARGAMLPPSDGQGGASAAVVSAAIPGKICYQE